MFLKIEIVVTLKQQKIAELGTVVVAGIDGTFKTVPKSPPELKKSAFVTSQMVYMSVVSRVECIVHINIWSNHSLSSKCIPCTLQSFPMVYAFLMSMNQESYQARLNVVRNLLPSNYEQLCIITDFEIPLMNSV